MSGHNLDPNITKMTSPSINYWLQRFVLEARGINIVLIACIKCFVVCKGHLGLVTELILIF